jgi:hypothetical protein
MIIAAKINVKLLDKTKFFIGKNGAVYVAKHSAPKSKK